jgi:hypothetical protein
LLSAVEVKKRRCFANVTGATSSLAIYQIWNHWNAQSMVAIILSITSVKMHLSK